MYREFLDDAAKAHYTYADVFGESAARRIKAFVMPHYSIDMHSQAFFEINIIVRGGGMHYIGAQRMPVERGDLFVVPPNVRHGYSSQGELDVYHILMHQLFFTRFDEELKTLPLFHELFHIEPIMRADGSLNLHLKIGDDQWEGIDGLLEDLQRWSTALDAAAMVMMSGGVLTLIARLCELYRRQSMAPCPEESVRMDADFMKSLSLIYDHYGDKLSIEQLAGTAFLSRNAYIGKFKGLMGATPTRFLLQYRIKKAEELLTRSNLPVHQVAAQTGFYDMSHFSRSFLRLTGRSPAAYRRQCRQENSS